MVHSAMVPRGFSRGGSSTTGGASATINSAGFITDSGGGADSTGADSTGPAGLSGVTDFSLAGTSADLGGLGLDGLVRNQHGVSRFVGIFGQFHRSRHAVEFRPEFGHSRQARLDLFPRRQPVFAGSKVLQAKRPVLIRDRSASRIDRARGRGSRDP